MADKYKDIYASFEYKGISPDRIPLLHKLAAERGDVIIIPDGPGGRWLTSLPLQVTKVEFNLEFKTYTVHVKVLMAGLYENNQGISGSGVAIVHGSLIIRLHEALGIFPDGTGKATLHTASVAE